MMKRVKWYMLPPKGDARCCGRLTMATRWASPVSYCSQKLGTFRVFVGNNSSLLPCAAFLLLRLPTTTPLPWCQRFQESLKWLRISSLVSRCSQVQGSRIAKLVSVARFVLVTVKTRNSEFSGSRLAKTRNSEFCENPLGALTPKLMRYYRVQQVGTVFTTVLRTPFPALRYGLGAGLRFTLLVQSRDSRLLKSGITRKPL